MNNYIKLEDAINAYNQAVKKLVKNEMEEFDLGDFTECQFNTTQIKLIARMIANLPAIKVDEDCISRKRITDRIICKCFELNDDYDIQHILEDIKNAPSVIPDRAEGEWIYIDEPIMGNPYGRYRCSECEMDKPHKTDYCPNCGAKMKGANNE